MESWLKMSRLEVDTRSSSRDTIKFMDVEMLTKANSVLVTQIEIALLSLFKSKTQACKACQSTLWLVASTTHSCSWTTHAKATDVNFGLLEPTISAKSATTRHKTNSHPFGSTQELQKTNQTLSRDLTDFLKYQHGTPQPQ